HRASRTEGSQFLAIRALVEEKPRLVLAAGGHAKAQTVLANHRGWRRLRRTAVERLLLLYMFLCKPIELTVGEVAREGGLDGAATAVHAGGKELQYKCRAEAIHDQPTQAVAFGVDDPVGICDVVEVEPATPEGNGLGQSALKEGLVDRFDGIRGEEAEGDA